MRKILITSIFVLIFCVFVSGQDSFCPKVILSGPPAVPEENEPVTFSVSVDEKAKDLKLEYVWSVDKGKVIEGQGTFFVMIQPDTGETVTATVEMKGLPAGCENTFTETIACGLRAPHPKLIDELLTSDSRIDSARLDKIAAALKDDLSATAYIIIYTDEKTPPPIPEQKEKQIRDYLKSKNIPPERIVIVRGGEGKDLIRLWLVPAGATPPTP